MIQWERRRKDVLKSLGWRKSPKWFAVTDLESGGCCGNRHQTSSFLCCFGLEHVHKRVISAVIWNRGLWGQLEEAGEAGGEAAFSAVPVAVGRAAVPQPRRQPAWGMLPRTCTYKRVVSGHCRTTWVLWLLSASWMCEGESSCSCVPASNHRVHTECLNMLLKCTSAQSQAE